MLVMEHDHIWCYVTWIGFPVVLMIVFLLLHKYAAVIISATLGSYLLLRGSGWLIGGYPSPGFILHALNTG